MIRYRPYLKGEHVYSEVVDHALCDTCNTKADYAILSDRYNDEITYLCKEHLEVKEYILQGRCDGCYKHSFEPWLRLVLVKPNLEHLCKQCFMKKRKERKI